MTNKFKINQYNWFSQKLLTQHRYSDILKLRQYLLGIQPTHLIDNWQQPISNHLSYLSGLALMKTSTRLDELIFALQRLNFQKDSQYFLLLCQCSLYLGNHDAVVALCKQTFNKEIDTIPAGFHVEETPELDPRANQEENNSSSGQDNQEVDANELAAKSSTSPQQGWCLESICDESLEFKKIFESIIKNRLINDARLWFTFALSLEFQLQYKDADLAYRVASKLTSGQTRQTLAANNNKLDTLECSNTSDTISPSSQTDDGQHAMPAAMSNYFLPHVKYAEFRIRQRNDFKTAAQILCQASSRSPMNHTLSPLLALIISSQPSSNSGHFAQAIEIISALDVQSLSNRNPSFVYNQLVLECKQKLYSNLSCANSNQQFDTTQANRIANETRFDPNYALIKSFILLNNIIQNSRQAQTIFKCSIEPTKINERERMNLNNQIDKSIECLKSCDSTCWSSSAALWNNLGICYLAKRQLVATLSCLIKAHQMNPLDWRINYNLALAFLHVGLIPRALTSLLASKSFYPIHKTVSANALKYEQSLRSAGHQLDHRKRAMEPLISTLMAICYSELQVVDEARRLYAEMVAWARKSSSASPPVLTLVNYLLLLRQNKINDQLDELDIKLICRLLDQLEQAWLQRSQHDAQFNVQLLEVARLIGNEVSQYEQRPQMRKTYAWTK